MVELRQWAGLEVVQLCLVTLKATEVTGTFLVCVSGVPVARGPAASHEAAQGLAYAKALREAGVREAGRDRAEYDG